MLSDASELARAVAGPTVGIEIETLCPPGGSRHGLAAAIGEELGGSLRAVFHLDTELSTHPDVDVFHNATKAFEVVDGDGGLVVAVRDDSSVIADLEAVRSPAGEPDGPVRIAADDRRLLRLVTSVLDPMDPTGPTMDAMCVTFGLDRHRLSQRSFLLVNADDETVAVVAPSSRRRERVAELVSPRLDASSIGSWLGAVLGVGGRFELSVPHEGAVHLHFDAPPFDSADSVAALVRWFDAHREVLRTHYRSNPACLTLRPFAGNFVSLACRATEMRWPEKRAKLLGLHGARFGDVNLTGLLDPAARHRTIEMRFLAPTTDAASIERWAFELGGLVTMLHDGSLEPDLVVSAEDLARLLDRCRELGSLGPPSVVERHRQ